MILRLLAHRSVSWPASPHSSPVTRHPCLIALACALFCFCAVAADPDHCGICGKGLGPTIYRTMDHVTHEKVFMCYACAVCPDECYICGLPAVLNSVKLVDGRFL